ncbi:MAG: family 16 glycoside hydrolase [Gemmataceae bacterium]
MRSLPLLALLLAAPALAGEKEKLFVATPFTKDIWTPGIEGPNCDKDGNVYAVNLDKEQTIGKVTPDGHASVFVTLPGKSTGNGIVFDPAGFMYVADYVGHNVLKIDPKTKKISVYAHDDRMNQPNDLAIHPNGDLYASDPSWAKSTGQLWRIDKAGKTHLIAKDMGTTNGIEVSPDGKTLYVNESVQRNVWAFAIDKDGSIKDKRLLAKFPDHGFDGMRADVEGNLYITRHGKGTVAVLSPEGKVLREIDVLGTKPSNICFGGKDGRTVYVTEVDGKRLVQFRVDKPGLAWKRWQDADPTCCDVDEGFRDMFNGKDLTGWVNVNCDKSTFFVRDGMIITTGRPTGFLRTDKQYENFIMEFEWKHMPKPITAVGNSGLFVWGDPIPAVGTGYTRGIEVQVLVNLEKPGFYTSQGDIFSIWGAKCKPDRPHPNGWDRCLPSENRTKGAGEWNHYRVEGNDGAIKLAVNGKIVSGVHSCNPRKGYLALESEGSECHFKNLKIKELPTKNPRPEEIADVDKGFKSIYTGLNLDGWKADPKNKGAWNPRDFMLDYNGKGTDLWSEKEYGDFEMIVDWRFPAKPKKTLRPVILPSGEEAKDDAGKPKMVEVDDAGDSGIYLRGSSKSQVNMWCWPIGSGEVYGYRTDPKMSAEVRKGVTPKERADKPLGQWNRFHITMKGDRLTVVLNGKTVIENAQLPGVAPRGPIALQHHGDAVQFANLFIRELKD